MKKDKRFLGDTLRLLASACGGRPSALPFFRSLREEEGLSEVAGWESVEVVRLLRRAPGPAQDLHDDETC